MNLISAFDLHFEQALYAMRDPSLVQFFAWITALGDVYTIMSLTMVVTVILAYRKRWSLIGGLCFSVFGSIVVAFVVKHLVARPRPAAPLFAYVESSPYAFPSVHATLAAAFYIFVLWLIYDTFPPKRRYLMTTATVILILAIGFSRLYLGVHYPSDVLAGYMLGGLSVLLGIKVTKYLEQKTTSV